MRLTSSGLEGSTAMHTAPTAVRVGAAEPEGSPAFSPTLASYMHTRLHYTVLTRLAGRVSCMQATLVQIQHLGSNCHKIM